MRIVCSSCEKKDKIIALGKSREWWIIGFCSFFVFGTVLLLDGITPSITDWIFGIFLFCVGFFCAVKSSIKDFQRGKLEEGGKK